ncbi:hypothetical protein [Streptomyces erythrochromogenes]|jgi:hypothetical protein|uniref:hypothetical protein n=1 Tax=Streptomyces erythrochromogenes TaxID=285574 RepID=UPI0022578F5B|nr:hypothetical protein [Streptomyces erythrochromogenes]MCX5584223.1 hypothetical protein [Streptomyces erythrochromogenes]
MTEPIRIDMSDKGSSFGEAFMQALLTGRPLVMFDSSNPEAGEVGMGLELDVLEDGASDGH